MDTWEQEALNNMTEKEIRRAQDLVFQQQRMAYEQNNIRALEKLNEWELCYADELYRRISVN